MEDFWNFESSVVRLDFFVKVFLRIFQNFFQNFFLFFFNFFFVAGIFS